MILIVGMGLTGITIAEQLATKHNMKVLMIEKENNIGGIHYDYDCRNVVIGENDPNIFLSNNDELWNYINSYSQWNKVSLNQAIYFNKEIIPFDISCKQINSIYNCFLSNETDLQNFLKEDKQYELTNCENIVINSSGEKLYETLYRPILYNKWKINSLTLSKNVGQEFIKTMDTRNNINKYSALPSEGYNMYFKKILSNPNIKYILNTDFDMFRNNNDLTAYSQIIYTGKIDDYFTDLQLDYIGYKNKTVPHMNFFQQHAVVTNIDNSKYDRIIEHKHFQNVNDHTKHTFVTFQTYVKNSKPYLPVEHNDSVNMVKKRIQENKNIEPTVHFVGRLAEYKNMDTASIIENALTFVEKNFKEQLVSDIEYSESIGNIFNMNIDNTINQKVTKAKQLLKEAYNMKYHKLNNSEHLFKIKTHAKIDMTTIDDHVIVISRYNENIDWINEVIELHSWVKNIIVFNKGKDDIIVKYTDKITVHPVENIGREGETYLQYMIHNYESLPEHIWFVQANPFEHSPDFINLLSFDSVKEYNRLYQCLTYRYLKDLPSDITKDNRFYINNNRVIDYFIDKYDQQVVDIHSFYDYAHEQKVIDMESKYDTNKFECYYDFLCDYIGIDKPEHKIIGYTWSAMFYVNKSQILQHTRNVYEKLRFKLMEYDPQGGFEGYMLERIWNYVFTKRSYSSLNELYRFYKFTPYSTICGCYIESCKMLFIMENYNNENSYIYKTPLYCEGKSMLYIEKNDIFVLENSRFNNSVLERVECNNLTNAKQVLMEYYNTMIENEHKNTFIK
jgi:UDP-galactopyranose mutase